MVSKRDERTKIAWCDYTFNGWKGCVKVAPECQLCYAEAWAKIYGQAEWGVGVPRIRTKTWGKPRKWNKEAGEKGTRYSVFAFSVGDPLEDKPDQPELNDWRAGFWKLVEETTNLDWMILTKRPENIARMIPDHWHTRMPKHIIWGTSIGTQKRVSKLFHFLEVPAYRFFISCEPMLEQVDFTKAVHPETGETHNPLNWGIIDQIICGGESNQLGVKARAFHIENATHLLEQCRAHDIPFFMKQLGNAPMLNGKPYRVPAHDKKGEKLESWPKHLRVQEPYRQFL